MAFIAPLPSALSNGSRSQTSLSPRHGQPLRAASTHRVVAPQMSATKPATGGPVRSTEADTPTKKFLDRLKALEKVRLIVRNESGIMESIATFDGMFFATIPTGEYANLIDPAKNLDLHLLLDKVTGARFDIGVSRTPSRVPTYSIRILASDRETVALSVFLQWDKQPEDIAEARIQAWKDLKADYVKGDGDTFFFDE